MNYSMDSIVHVDQKWTQATANLDFRQESLEPVEKKENLVAHKGKAGYKYVNKMVTRRIITIKDNIHTGPSQ